MAQRGGGGRATSGDQIQISRKRCSGSHNSEFQCKKSDTVRGSPGAGGGGGGGWVPSRDQNMIKVFRVSTVVSSSVRNPIRFGVHQMVSGTLKTIDGSGYPQVSNENSINKYHLLP